MSIAHGIHYVVSTTSWVCLIGLHVASGIQLLLSTEDTTVQSRVGRRTPPLVGIKQAINVVVREGTCVEVAGGVFGERLDKKCPGFHGGQERNAWFRHVVTEIQERGALFGCRRVRERIAQH